MIKLNEVHKVYTQGKHGFHALKDINLFFEKGEIVCILGPSGCGKTTLLNVLGGLDMPTSGDMVIDDRLTTNFVEKEWDYFRNHRIGFIFQQYNLIEHLPIVENVALSCKLSGEKNKSARSKAIELLKKVGLEQHLHKLPGELSGGERQRVSIARALINDPDIILADEPTGALDKKTGTEIMDLIKSICADKLVIVVTHNKYLAKNYASRVIELKDGRVVSDTSPIDKKVKIVNVKTRNKKKLKFVEAVRLSIYNIKGKFFRTLLVALGLSVGIVGLILIDAFFNSARMGLEQQNAVLKDNPDIFIHETYEEGYDVDAMQQTLKDYGYFKDVVYSPRNLFSITRNVTNNADLSNRLTGNGVELPENDDLLSTFTTLIGDSRLPENDSEMVLYIDQASKLISSNLNFSDEELWDELKNNQYTIYDAYQYRLSEDKLYNELNNGTCLVTDIWNKNIETPPQGYDELILGSIADNMDALSAYRSEPILFFDTQEVYCQNYDEMSWYLDYSLPLGEGYTVTLVGIHSNKLFPEIILSDNIVKNAQYQVNYYDSGYVSEYLLDSTIRFRAFLNNDEIDNKSAIILDVEGDNYLIEENYGNGLSMFEGLIDLFMYILQFIFSSIIGIAVVTGGLMLLLILFISIIERKREIGLIRAMGGTRSDVRIIYTGETMMIGLMAGIISVILSIGLVALLNMVIYHYYFDLVIEYLPFIDPEKVLTINFTKLIIAIIVSILIALISGLAPAIRASRKAPIEALRNE